MKFSYSIPLTTLFVLFLTLCINIIGLKFSLEKHFPIYTESVQKKFENQVWLNPEHLQEIFAVNSLDPETQADYAEALDSLSKISSSLESLSKNPELYISDSQSGATTANSFHISLANNIAESISQNAYHKGISSLFSHPFSFDRDTPEWQFFIKIMTNFLILNTIWLAIIMTFYILWIRRIFRPIHLIIDTLKDFSISKNSPKISYKKRNEFRPLIHTLNELYASLGQQEKIRNQFLSDLSHEIRTPMTAISCLLEAIDDGIIELDKTTIITLQKEMHRLVDITEHIMKSENFLSENTEKKSTEKIFLQKIFDEISLQYKPKCVKNFQKIQNNFKKDEIIDANSEQFIQILHNIFSNFCKYAWENAILTAEFSQEKNSKILIFRDTGIGISDEELPFLTEKFYKSDTGRNQNSDELSMGIWLSLVSKIMALHSGNLRISHTKPHGLTIFLTFPKNEKNF